MGIRAEPGVTPDDIVRVQPLHYVADPRGEDWGSSWQPRGPKIEAISKQLTSGEAFIEGKKDLTVAFILWVDYIPGRPLPVDVKDRVWHPEISRKLADGTPDYATALEVTSVVPQKKSRICQIDCGRTY